MLNFSRSGDYAAAEAAYSAALELCSEPEALAVLHSNRAAARIELGQYPAALQDAQRSRAHNPCWDKASSPATALDADASAGPPSSASPVVFLQAYLREAAALVCLHRPAEALAALRAGLQQVRQSVCLQEAYAALPGLAGAPTGAGPPAPCGEAAAEGLGAPGAAGEPKIESPGRVDFIASTCVCCAGHACALGPTLAVCAGAGRARLPVTVLSGFLGAGCGSPAVCVCAEHAAAAEG